MINVRIGDSRDVLKEIHDKSVHCCITSPPYYGLRDYGVDGQIGLEQTPEEYVNELVKVFREVKRVLRDDGTLWLNLGDSYSGSNKGKMSDGSLVGGQKQRTNKGTMIGSITKTGTPQGLKPKDLIGIPWRVAFALQADGWYLRQDIIWSKNNPMPESVTDRCTKSHEYIFLFSKSAKYYFDNEAIKENSVTCDPRRPYTSNGAKQLDNREVWHSGEKRVNGDFTKRNKRSVWQINTKPYKAAHFATFPPALVEPCIKAGTSENGVCSVCGTPYQRIIEKDTKPKGRSKGDVYTANAYSSPQSLVWGKKKNLGGDQKQSITVGWEPSCYCNALSIPAMVLDPFGGSGTVGEVCNKLNRNAILIELNPEYKKLILDRTGQSLANFEEVRV